MKKHVYSIIETACLMDNECDHYAHDVDVDREWFNRVVRDGRYVIVSTREYTSDSGNRYLSAILRLKFPGQHYPGVPIRLLVWEW